MKTLESSLICEIQSCSSSNHLSRSFLITQFRCQIQKLWSKHWSHMITSNLMRKKNRKSHVWDSILRPIFDNVNVGIKLNSWNTKLFIIELVFQIFLNQSISISESEVMIKILELPNHTKPCENTNPSSKTKVLPPLPLPIRFFKRGHKKTNEKDVLVIH